jgi:GNAT superfamily N-acetyltransferase
MRSDGWHLTEDLDEFPTQAMEFLRSRPARHTTLLTVVDKMRTPRAAAPGRPVRVLGWLEREGEVLAVSHWSTGMGVTALTPEQADEFAVYHVALGHALSIVTAEHDTATAFAEAWQRHTGTTPTVRVRLHLYRLGTLTGPERFPAGRGRALDERDHEDLMSWCRDFAAAVDEDVTIDADTWASTRFAEKRYTFWETAEGTPVSMAGATPLFEGMVRVDPVYTPAHLRGRGYAAAVTAEVTRAALAAGATDVVLYTDPANPTSNALYQRLGYVRLTDFTVYDLAPATAEAERP